MLPGPHRRVAGCAAVEFSESMVRVAGTRTEARLPREQVRHIQLVYDTAAGYPFTQFFVGFLLVTLGGIGVVVLLLTGLRDSLPIDMESGVVSLNLVPTALWLTVALGIGLLAGVFRARYQLAIETDDGMRRVVLGTSADLPDIRRLVGSAIRSFGYEIDTSVLDETETRP